MPWKWEAPTFSVGWLIALVVMIAVLMAWGFGRADMPLVFVVAAICALRL